MGYDIANIFEFTIVILIFMLFAISSEPGNIQEYIKEVSSEAWKIDPDLFRKAKDNFPTGIMAKMLRSIDSSHQFTFK